jgi:hypothetical protein
MSDALETMVACGLFRAKINSDYNDFVTAKHLLVTNRKHAARMALQKRFSKVRKQFVDC